MGEKTQAPGCKPLLLPNSGNFMNGKRQTFQSLMNSACGSGEFILVLECEVSADRQNLQMHFIHMVASPTTA